MDRRTFLVGVAAAAACRPRPAPPLAGALLGHDVARSGHRVREPRAPARPSASDAVDVLIVGGGVAGLSAAWRLRVGGFRGSIRVAELDDALGGTARGDRSPITAYPWGAHYITLPSREARHVRRMLEAFGVVVGHDAEGRPRFDPRALCAAPGERLFAGGRWLPGLWDDLPVDGEAAVQRAAFRAEVATWRDRVGADGRPAFAIPIAASSEDPAIRALADVSFSAWLDAHGFTDPVLRASCRYATRDDYGAEPHAVSAWAGLHYLCARRPWAAEGEELGTDVLVWPEGNAWLVDRLAAAARAEVWTGAFVGAVVADATGVRADVDWKGARREVRACHVVLAVPPRVADHLLGQPGAHAWPELAPWRVANLHVSALPASQGVPTAWDSVLAAGRGLGYVTATHQQLTFRGPSVLTWYQPLSDVTPVDGRRALLRSTWAAERDLVLDDLAAAHPDLPRLLQRLDVRHWGHGTAIPAVGLHRATLPVRAYDGPGAERVSVAHASLSGVSLFEEASWHGVRAGEEALATLGIGSESLL